MKKMFRMFLALSLVLLVGCATNQTEDNKLSPDAIASIKSGMMKADVIKVLGEPWSQSTDSDGNEILRFRQESGGNGWKKFAQTVGDSAPSDEDLYFDFLTVWFKKDVVLKTTYDKHAHHPSTGAQ